MYTLKYLFYSSIFIKLIVVSLVIGFSVITAIGLSKIKRLSYIKAYIDEFERQFWSGIDLSDFYEANKENLNHPLGMIFKAVFEEWNASSNLRSQIGSKADIKERMLNVAHIQKMNVMQTSENYMDTLAMFIRVAPFVGLLGTVIGMMDVFYNIDLENGLTMNNAATGIGGSLVCIVFSVIVSVISMVLFWFFNAKIQDISNRLDIFIVDLLGILGRGLDGTATSGVAVDQVQQVSIDQNQSIKEADSTSSIVDEDDV